MNTLLQKTITHKNIPQIFVKARALLRGGDFYLLFFATLHFVLSTLQIPRVVRLDNPSYAKKKSLVGSLSLSFITIVTFAAHYVESRVRACCFRNDTYFWIRVFFFFLYWHTQGLINFFFQYL